VRSYDATVAMWACPHCGVPQAEAARCWVCHRSSTTCSTCRHFRTSLAADVGYCGKDRWRTPLTGLELRACWEEGRRVAAGPGATAGRAPTGAGDPAERRSGAVVRGNGGPLDRPDPMRLRGFVPLDELVQLEQTAAARPSHSDAVPGPPMTEPNPPGGSVPPTPPPGRANAAESWPGGESWAGRITLFGDPEG
jgi:hypothetical protein